jgi:preprotein translocase subunit SecY
LGIIIDSLVGISQYLPEIKAPVKEVPFKQKMLWTASVLLIFFILGQISLFGLDPNSVSVQQIMFAQTILASNIGTLLTAGIGPIVMASIFLQLFSGAKLIDLDMSSPEGRSKFQALQKVLAVALCFIEGYIYIGSGLLAPTPGMLIPLVLQVAVGSLILLYLDEIVSKWGIGSGISLFIAAGVSASIFWQVFRPSLAIGQASGILWNFLATGNFVLLLPIIGIIAIFLIVVFAEGMHVNIPITMGHRGTGGRYPVKFLYVSNMPVILAMALFMNVQLWALFVKDIPIMNTIMGGIGWAVASPSIGGQSLIAGLIYQGALNSITIPAIIQAIVFMIVLIVACVVFGIFWVEMGNQSTDAVATQLEKSGMQIPGFRKDRRVIKKVLNRYIPPITILGSIFVALLAGGGDLVLSGISSGTGILLTVGIIYRFYEEIAKSQADLLAPLLGKL